MENFKLELIEKIIQIDDSKLLLKIKNLIENSNNDLILKEPEVTYDKKDKLYYFSEEQISVINKSIEEYKNGEFLTDEEAEIDLKEWFAKQER
jgi:hypothetical protein